MNEYKRYCFESMASHSVYLGVRVRSAMDKMPSRMLIVMLIVQLTCTSSSEGAPAPEARQLQPALPGYIPVFIRPGDTPLEEINPDLAEAFASYAKKHRGLIYGRSINEVLAEQALKLKAKSKSVKTPDLEDLTLEEDNSVGVGTEKIIVKVTQHIQKIPKP